MALINKINEKSGIIVGVVAVALILFMLGGDLLSSNSIFNFGKDRVGKINGESISLSQYQIVLGNQEREYQIQTDRTVGENERVSLEFQAWNELITRFAYKPEFQKLGLVVTEEELADMVQGKFIHSYIKGAFGGDESFDKQVVQNFLSQYDQMDPVIKAKWDVIENNLPEIRIKEKYINLLKKTEYVTKAEAKRVYAEQNNKAEVKYVYVPYSSLSDSAVEANDKQLEAYIKKNKDKYKVEAGRSLEYAVFNLVPTEEDSLLIKKDAEEIAHAFRQTQNDTMFIGNNSDAPALPEYMTIGELPDELSRQRNISVDSVYGPYLSNGKYAVFKVLETKNDSVATLRASHILFRIDEDKNEARKQANEVLAQLKKGASFAEMARLHGTDGTSSRGGDLGWFSNNGQMVKPFEDACFRFNGKGLLPNLVETQFGYHIIEITEPKTSKKFLIAKVEKDIVPMDATRDVIYNKAATFASKIKDTASFHEELKKEPALQRYTYPNAAKNDRALTGISNAREVIRWAYNEASVGDVSPVFSLDNQYVVVLLTAKRDEGTAAVNDVKHDVSIKVKNELKGDQIIEKLSKLSGDFDKIAADYGTGAQSGTASNVLLSSSSISVMGYDPVASGKVFGLKPGQKTEAFKGESGVVILELVNIQAAPEVADYNQFKSQKETQRAASADYFVDEAIKKLADVKDERYKFY
jgi:peptidyl-prolyl cis-trans isomerase D